MRSFSRPWARRSILALAILQLMVSVFAPLHDQRASTDRGAVRVERLHTGTGTPAHDPDNCVLCRAMHVQFLRPAPTSIAVVVRATHRPVSAITTLLAARPPPTAHLTRAPPAPLA